MQDGYKEIGQNHGTSDAKAMWSTLAKQHCTKNASPNPMTKRCEQSPDNCLYDRGANVTTAEQKRGKCIAGAFKSGKSHAHSSSQQQPIHLRGMTHPSRHKGDHRDFASLFTQSNDECTTQSQTGSGIRGNGKQEGFEDCCPKHTQYPADAETNRHSVQSERT